jgi:hypothetical protein
VPPGAEVIVAGCRVAARRGREAACAGRHEQSRCPRRKQRYRLHNDAMLSGRIV